MSDEPKRDLYTEAVERQAQRAPDEIIPDHVYSNAGPSFTPRVIVEKEQRDFQRDR